MVLLECLQYVNLVQMLNVFKLYNLYFMLVFNFIMCFLEKDDKTSCSKTEMK